jgi:hypothetical protein
MDEQRFDDFTRLVGSGVSRRRIFGGLFGATFGLHHTRAHAQECTNPDTCSAPAECCAGFTCDSTTAICVAEPPPCMQYGYACADPAECCTGVCLDGWCQDTCAYESERCSAERPCCDGVSACEEGVCAHVCTGYDCDCCPGSWCVAEGGDCASIDCTGDGDCPTRSAGCYDGWCVDFDFRSCDFTGCAPGYVCVGEIDRYCYRACANDTDCTDGGVCCGDHCLQVECCSADPARDARCGEGGTCAGYLCQEAECAGQDQKCGADAGCCNDLICVNGTCREEEPGTDGGTDEPDRGPAIHTLPATGTGSKVTSSGPLKTLALAAGATTLTAARLLLRRWSEPQ